MSLDLCLSVNISILEHLRAQEKYDNSQLGRFNPLKPNDPYRGRTAPLTSKRCILCIYSTNIGTDILNMVYTLRFFLFKMQFVS